MSDRLPNLVNAGVTKAGTTSLYGYLSQHPDICPADHKDLNHYSPLRFGDPPTESLEDYAAHFAHCAGQTYRLDASPDYFTGGRRLIEWLDRDLPSARVVVTLRDPVRRLWSAYTYKQSRGVLPADVTFRETFERDLVARRTGSDRTREGQHHRALSTGFYAEHLREWFEVLGPERLRVVFFEDLVTDASAEMMALCHWLGVDPSPVADMELSARNPTVQPRSQSVRRVAEWINVSGRPLLRRLPAVERQLRAVYGRFNGRARDPFPEEDRRRVVELYADSTAELAELLSVMGHRRLPAWVVDPTSR